MNIYVIAVDKRSLVQKFFSAISAKNRDNEFETAIIQASDDRRKNIDFLKKQGFSKSFEIAAENANEAVMTLWFSQKINAGQWEPLLKQAKELDLAGPAPSAPKTTPSP